MPIRDLQLRARELGRIRIGQVVPTTRRDGTAGTRPEKLDRFRLTSHSRPLLEKVAALYGGAVAEWTPQGGGVTAWEVLTDSNRIPIMVPPQPVSQWMEHWQAGGCKRRCDSVTELLSDQPCICKADEVELCKPTTRLNVVLRDVEGIGVWRLESKGWSSAIELPDTAKFLAQAGGYVDGWLALEQRTSKAEVVRDGETKIEVRHFMVPMIEISVTPAELMAGKGRVGAASLSGGPVARPALEAGRGDSFADAFAEVASATTFEELAGVWDRAKAVNLVGPTAPDSPRMGEFVAAFKGRAHEIRAGETAAAEESSTVAEPVATVAADVPAAAAAEVVEGSEDADAVWAEIVALAGTFDPPLSTSQLTERFSARYGLAPGTATAAELRFALDELRRGAEQGAAVSS